MFHCMDYLNPANPLELQRSCFSAFQPSVALTEAFEPSDNLFFKKKKISSALAYVLVFFLIF